VHKPSLFTQSSLAWHKRGLIKLADCTAITSLAHGTPAATQQISKVPRRIFFPVSREKSKATGDNAVGRQPRKAAESDFVADADVASHLKSYFL